MDAARVAEIIRHSCGDKPRYPRGVARSHADGLNARRRSWARPFYAYRCPFLCQHHPAEGRYHVGRLLTEEKLTELADAVRWIDEHGLESLDLERIDHANIRRMR